VSSDSPETINLPIINSFSGEVISGSIDNILLHNNSNCSFFWSSMSDINVGHLPSWVVFDFINTITLNEFHFSNYGDTTHDVTLSTLYYSALRGTLSMEEPWIIIATLESQYNTSASQIFATPNITSRYFKWEITNFGKWLPCVRPMCQLYN
jgi:hypothetical protein